MIIFLSCLCAIQFCVIIAGLIYARILPNPFVSRKPKPRPQNPNSAVQECQFCGVLGAIRSRDGYWACRSCMIIKLGQIGT